MCLLFVIGSVFFSSKHTPSSVAQNATSTTQASSNQAFDSLSLEAKAVYVFDIREEKALYEKNGDLPLPLASITKVLTALVAMETLSSDTVVTITPAHLATDGESGLTVGEQWDLPDLVSFMLITSSNDAATALRSAYEVATDGSFIAAMNSEARRLGLHGASFTNETGLDIGGSASNTGSAKDAAILLAAALRAIPEALDATRYESFTFVSRTGTTHKVTNTNELANIIPWAVGAKTGFTDSAGGNLAISFDPSIGRPVVIVVLGSSKDGRFSDVKRLVTATLATIQEL
jgi:D-alanyl-D-alanine carboxypeptidase